MYIVGVLFKVFMSTALHWHYAATVMAYESLYIMQLPLTASVAWWSEFLATDPEARVRFPALPDFLTKKKKKTVVGLEQGPLSLVSTNVELLDWKVAAPV
jgi:hypothetical protein